MANPLDITNILCLIIVVISIIGSSMVCHIIIRTKSMKTVMNYLLLNLALLDVITGFIAIFKVIFDGDSNVIGTSNLLEQVYNKSAITADVFCKVEASFFIGTAVTPTLLMAIAYERYMAVVNPLTRRADGVTKVRLKWILAPVCWLSGIAILVVDVLSASYQEGTCELAKLHWFDIKVYTVFVAILHYVIPSLVIFVFYFRVIKTLRSTEVLGVQGAAQKARNKARRTVVLIVITVAVIFYVLTGIPQVSYFLLEVFGIRSWTSSTTFLVLLFTMNCVSNPLIYFTFMKPFRDRLIKMICKCKNELSEGNLIIINGENSLKRYNTSSYGNYNLDNRLENEPKLLRISECSVTMPAN